MRAPERDLRPVEGESPAAKRSDDPIDGTEPDTAPLSHAPRTAMKTSQAVSMAVCVAFGFAYFGWVAFTEGWRFWLVASVVATFATLGFVAHRVMGVGRRQS